MFPHDTAGRRPSAGAESRTAHSPAPEGSAGASLNTTCSTNDNVTGQDQGGMTGGSTEAARGLKTGLVHS